MILSCVGVILTIFAYVLLFETLNQFAKTLVCYCASLLGVFLTLTVLQFNPDAIGPCVIYGEFQ